MDPSPLSRACFTDTPAKSDLLKQDVSPKTDKALAQFGTCAIEDPVGNAQKALGVIHEDFNAVVLKRTLLDMSANERKLLDQTYKEQYGLSLGDKLKTAFSGAEREELVLYLNRPDTKGDLSKGLLQIWGGELRQSNGPEMRTVENKILRQLAGMNSDDTAALGEQNRQEILSGMSPQAAEAANIYLKGINKQTMEDQVKLGKLAIDVRDPERFQMTMATAREETRQRFAQRDLQDQITSAFGDDAAVLRHARDYAQTGTRQADSKVLDNLSALGDNEEQIEKALREMSPAEKDAYRHGKELALDLQTKGSDSQEKWTAQDTQSHNYYDKVVGALLKATGGGSDQSEFQGYESIILRKDNADQKPENKLLASLAGSKSQDNQQVIGAVQAAFSQDPGLKERIDQDASLREQFNNSLKSALGDENYRHFGKPLLERGVLSPEEIKSLNSGWTDDNEASFYRGMASLGKATEPASQAEKNHLLNDPAYQDRVFSYLSSEERQVALNALRQGDLKPEDQLRSFILHSREDKDSLTERLAELPPQEKEALKQAYDNKYGDWRADVANLGNEDRKVFLEALNSHALGMQDNHAVLTQAHADTRGTAFSHKIDKYWDGTGHDVDDKLNKLTSKVEGAAAAGQELSSEEQRVLTRQFSESMAAHIESQAQAANAVADAAVTAASVGLALPTGGVSLGLLAKSAALSGAIRVGTKAYLMGDNYDATQAGKDAAMGLAEGATGAIGGGALGQMLKVGKGAAEKASSQVVANLGEDVLKEGGEEALNKGLQEIVTDAITDGAGSIDAEKLNALAGMVTKSSDPVEQAKVAAEIQKALDNTLTQDSHGLVEDAVNRTQLEAGANAMQGITASAVYNLGEWDNNKSVAENTTDLSKSMLMAGMIGIGGSGFSRLGHGHSGQTAETADRVQVKLGRPTEELDKKIPALKNDLGISLWDLPSTQRNKLIADLENNNRIQYHESKSGIVIDNGNTRIHLAEQLGVSHDQITIHTADGKKTLAQIEKEYLEKQKAAATPNIEKTIDKLTVGNTAIDLQALDKGGSVLIGRSVPGQKGLDSSISSEHAKIYRNDDGQLVIKETREQGSTYGTWVKNKGEESFQKLAPGKEFALTPGCEVKVGGNGTDASTAKSVNGLGDLPPNLYKKQNSDTPDQISNTTKLDEDSTLAESSVPEAKQQAQPEKQPVKIDNRPSGIETEQAQAVRAKLGIAEHLDTEKQKEVLLQKLKDREAAISIYNNPKGGFLMQAEDVEIYRYATDLGIKDKEILLRNSPHGPISMERFKQMHPDWQSPSAPKPPTLHSENTRTPAVEPGASIAEQQQPSKIEKSAEEDKLAKVATGEKFPDQSSSADTSGLSSNPQVRAKQIEMTNALEDALRKNSKLIDNGKPLGLENGSNSQGSIKEIEVSRPDGSKMKLVVQPLSKAKEGRGQMEQAQSELSASLFGSTPTGREMTVTIDGKPTKARVQEHAGEGLEKAIPNATSAESALKNDHDLKRSFREAAIERYIFGDTDLQTKNFTLMRDAQGRASVKNIDMEEITPSMAPDIAPQDEVARTLYGNAFADSHLAGNEMRGLADFVNKYDSPNGREQLRQLGYDQAQIDGILGRARSLWEGGDFPYQSRTTGNSSISAGQFSQNQDLYGNGTTGVSYDRGQNPDNDLPGLDLYSWQNPTGGF